MLKRQPPFLRRKHVQLPDLPGEHLPLIPEHLQPGVNGVVPCIASLVYCRMSLMDIPVFFMQQMTCSHSKLLIRNIRMPRRNAPQREAALHYRSSAKWRQARQAYLPFRTRHRSSENSGFQKTLDLKCTLGCMILRKHELVHFSDFFTIHSITILEF